VSFAPLRLDGGGLLQVFDVATAAVAALPGSTVAAGTAIAGADTQGFFKSVTAPVGNAWTVQNRGVGNSTFFRQVAAIMWSRTEANTIYAGAGENGHSGGLLVSTNAGVTWALRSGVPQFAGNTAPAPLPSANWARSTGRLLVQDAASTWLFAGTFGQGVLRDSANGTAGFAVACQMNSQAPSVAGPWYCRSLVAAPGSPATLYAAFYDSTGTTGAVWKCVNGHATTPGFTKLTGSPGTPEELLVLPNGNVYAACGNNGLYCSRDGGTTWTALNGGLNLGSYWSNLDGYTSGSNDIVFAVCGHTQVLAGNAVSVTVPSAGGAASYANLAGTVQQATIPPSNNTWWNSGSAEAFGKSGFVNPFIQFDPNDGTHQTVYLAGAQGMYRSVNGGATWTIANSGIPAFLAHPIAADPGHAGHVIFGDSDWGSFDDTAPGTENAATLVNNSPAHDAGPPSKGVQGYAMAFDPADSTVYCGTGRKYTNALGEIYARTWNNPGAVGTWDGGPFTGLTGGALGFGAAAGGNICVGMAALRDPGQPSHPYVLIAAAYSGGLWRFAWDVPSASYKWSQVSAVVSAGAPLSYYVDFAHVPGSQYVYCYDRNPDNLYRSSDYGATWALIWNVPASATPLSGDIAANPVTAGEVWVSSGGHLYKMTGAQTGTVAGGGIPAPADITPPGASPGPVAIGPTGTVYLATLDTGNGSGLLFSANGGGAWSDAVGDFSFANCCSTPEHIVLGSETPPRIYVAGSNVAATGFAGAGPAGSAAFTETQISLNFSGAAGSIPLFFSQPSGRGSAAGTALAVRLELSDCAMTVTPPNASWVLAAEGKAGAAGGQARAQIWLCLNNPGGLGAPGQASPDSQPLARRAAPQGRRRSRAVSGSAGGIAAAAGTPQVWTYSNAGAIVKGKIHEYATPAGTIQFLDQPALPLTGAAGTTPGGAGAVASATSLPVGAGAANTVTGGLALSMFGAVLSGGTTGQTWTTPSGWTGDGNAANLTGVFNCHFLPATSAGTTSITGVLALGTWTMTSWAAAVCTLYALAASPADITTLALPTPVPAGTAYPAATVAANGGAPPYTFTQTGGTMPPGLALASTGALTGTPTTPGTYVFSITVTDVAAQTDTDAFTIVVTTSSTLAITPPSLPPDTVGVPYPVTALTATGGSP
jgi:hypothetical protein